MVFTKMTEKRLYSEISNLPIIRGTQSGIVLPGVDPNQTTHSFCGICKGHFWDP